MTAEFPFYDVISRRGALDQSHCLDTSRTHTVFQRCTRFGAIRFSSTRLTQGAFGKQSASRKRGQRVRPHTSLHTSQKFLLSTSPHLHSILSFFSSVSSKTHTCISSSTVCSVVGLEMDSPPRPPPLLYSPLLTTPPLFLSLSSCVRSRERMDSGSVFIGSVFSTACSRAPLRG